MSVLPAVWLLVLGYTLLYVGLTNWRGGKITFQSALFGNLQPAKAAANPIQASGSSAVSGA